MPFIVGCSDLKTPTIGNITYTKGSTNSRPPGTYAQYSCEDNDIQRSCNISGIWQVINHPEISDPPECACKFICRMMKNYFRNLSLFQFQHASTCPYLLVVTFHMVMNPLG